MSYAAFSLASFRINYLLIFLVILSNYELNYIHTQQLKTYEFNYVLKLRVYRLRTKLRIKVRNKLRIYTTAK